jgi:hypothetical protein
LNNIYNSIHAEQGALLKGEAMEDTGQTKEELERKKLIHEIKIMVLNEEKIKAETAKLKRETFGYWIVLLSGAVGAIGVLLNQLHK